MNPKYIIPDKAPMGSSVKGAIKEVFASQKKTGEKSGNKRTKMQPFDVKNPNIISHDYVQIPQLKKIISAFELKNYNNLNWKNTHFRLHENGLYMPIIPEFMTHFQNVIQSYKSKGKTPLFDASGNPFTKDEVKDMYSHLTKDSIAVYEGAEGTWAWLDAYFEKKDDEFYILTEHRTQTDSSGNKKLVSNKTEKLEQCLIENCFVDFKSLNSQGLPITKDLNQKYIQGENIKFWSPTNDRVAWFFAYSDWALLDCGRNPDDTVSNLGVFAVADAT